MQHRERSLRTVTVRPAPAGAAAGDGRAAAVRDWLGTPRPVCDAGSSFKNDPRPVLAVRMAYDLLIHLHRVREAVPV